MANWKVTSHSHCTFMYSASFLYLKHNAPKKLTSICKTTRRLTVVCLFHGYHDVYDSRYVPLVLMLNKGRYLPILHPLGRPEPTSMVIVDANCPTKQSRRYYHDQIERLFLAGCDAKTYLIFPSCFCFS